MRLFASLTNRIFLATALLAVLSIVTAIFVVNVAVTRQAEDELRRGLEDAARLVEDHRSLLFEHFAREARLVADLPKLKAAVETNHGPTVEPIAADYSRQIDADLFVVTSPEGQPLAVIGQTAVSHDDVVDAVTASGAAGGVGRTWFWPQPGRVLQIVSVPIWIDPQLPELLGVLIVGFALDQAAVDRFKQLTASEVAITVDGNVLVSTIDRRHDRRLSGLFGDAGAHVSLDGEEFFVVMQQLEPATGPITDVAVDESFGPTPVAIVLRSRTARLEFLQPLQTALVITALVALLLAPLFSFVVARSVTRPLGAMTAAMRDIAATGDLTRAIPVSRGRWEDEDTRLLASTFNGLLQSIARFQREAGQRERLSSLGRLATVVAHEIRNPLMIIKATLRNLRRPDERPGRVDTAVRDIDEEVTRLNRIVTDVLDFARPIKFDLEPVDLNALCDGATAAMAADEPGAEIRLELDAAVGIVRTDRERLRLVLVNLLTNARDAVRALDSAGANGPAIVVRSRTTGEAVVVEVSDQGVGIAREDLPRVFEPYFTTKRTGTGLGLAIGKHIVDGLGGTLSVTSQPGAGTTMRVELPRSPSGAAAAMR